VRKFQGKGKATVVHAVMHEEGEEGVLEVLHVRVRNHPARSNTGASDLDGWKGGQVREGLSWRRELAISEGDRLMTGTWRDEASSSSPDTPKGVQDKVARAMQGGCKPGRPVRSRR
jgi:hypothetical protein